MRVVGASRQQVFRSVLAESAIIGFVSSAVGVGLGVAAAIGLEALLSGFGSSLPAGPLTFEPRTAIVGLAVGTLVTVVSAIGPARNAIRIPPVAALTDRPADDAASPARRRVISGTALTIFGALLLAIGLSKPVAALVGVGAVCIFIGVAMLAPSIVRPLAGALGRPLANWLGTPGTLGRQNSMRSPRRTAQTAAALMVGLALVSAMAVFGASFSESATSSVDHAISADLLVSVNGSGQLSDSVPAAAAAVPGVTATNTVYRNQFEFKSALEVLTGVTTQDLADTVTLRMTAGSAAALARGELLIDSTTATTDHLSVGETVPIRFAYAGPTTIKIGGIYRSNALIQSYLVSSTYFLAHFRAPQPGAVLLRTNGSPGVETAVSNALAPYTNVQVQTRAQFEQAQASAVNRLLGLVYALLALAVLIALIGIVNTLMLSVLERTREIGLLRAVGMRRPQVRAMIRSESVILAAFGAVIGIVVGTLMGLALVSSLRPQGFTETT
ncbi:MAG: FtsX-like permease family protein, partial [Streptosporangiaceae bacterium]